MAERKIGEIFECEGEWYQCISTGNCSECAFTGKRCYAFSIKGVDIIGDCTGRTFKKLEKVGEPFYSKFFGKFYQMYKTYIPAVGSNFKIRVTPVEYVGRNEIFIEIKQNKEDMEDLDKIKVRDYTKVEELNVMEEKKLNLKPFDLEAAKAGKPVCTRDGRKARIICFDRVGDFPIVALTDDREYKEEGVNLYDINGKGSNECFDLMMLPEKKEGWVNVYKHRIHNTPESAEEGRKGTTDYIKTIKIEWEE